VIAGREHLKDARLFECYLAERGIDDDVVPAGAAAHLERCAECAHRYSALSQLLDEERLAAEDETDALFPAERLISQRQHILARVEHAGQAARVLSFPARRMRRVSRPARGLPGWAAAAAAGLFLGMGLHIVYQSSQREPYRETASRIQAPPPPAATESSEAPIDPDAFFSTLDAALGGPRNPELMPLDELTPLAREVSMQVR
jgi:hypothetical protein